MEPETGKTPKKKHIKKSASVTYTDLMSHGRDVVSFVQPLDCTVVVPFSNVTLQHNNVRDDRNKKNSTKLFYFLPFYSDAVFHFLKLRSEWHLQWCRVPLDILPFWRLRA